jgi:hypothetical protein
MFGLFLFLPFRQDEIQMPVPHSSGKSFKLNQHTIIPQPDNTNSAGRRRRFSKTGAMAYLYCSHLQTRLIRVTFPIVLFLQLTDATPTISAI